MSRFRSMLTSGLVAAFLSMHGCFFYVSSGGGGCISPCYPPYPLATEEQVEGEPAYGDDW